MFNAGLLDIVGISAQQDACVVLPTLRHAIALWPRYQNAIAAVHGRHRVHLTKTAIIMLNTRTALRLWVPYERDPTMPMDWEVNRRSFELVSPYARGDVRV